MRRRIAVAAAGAVVAVGLSGTAWAYATKPSPEECRRRWAELGIAQDESSAVDVRWSWPRRGWDCVEVFEL